MTNTDGVILVVNREAAGARHLKELIEFMDSPAVETATPRRWRQTLGEHRLEALFVGPDLSDTEINSLMDGVSHIDPNVPIVLVAEHRAR